MTRLTAIAALIVLAAGCEPVKISGAFACGSDGTCVDGRQCDHGYCLGWNSDHSECLPTTCEIESISCGSVPNGCGETLSCGTDCDGGVDAGIDSGTLDSGFDAGEVDSGFIDSGPADSGPVDSGPADSGHPMDGGHRDAGPVDAGQHDAGTEDAGLVDAGTHDAGTEDAGPYDWVHVEPDPASIPNARVSYGMAYDSKRGKTVLFGGIYDGDLLADTWEWGGGEWNHVASTGPTARSGHAMVYDSAHQKTVLFGGQDMSANYLYDTWEWDGTSWTEATPAANPPGRRDHAMAFDSGRGVTVVFGGNNNPTAGNYLSDTWEWNGTNWTQRIPTIGTGPQGRILHGMAYDSEDAVTVMFGGEIDDGSPDNEAWTWDGANGTWTHLSVTSSPNARQSFAMAFDSVRNLTVIFGGLELPLSYDTWTLGGLTSTPTPTGTWTHVVGPDSPDGRDGESMVFDSQRNMMVLFGGTDVGGELNDTWEYLPVGAENADAGPEWKEESPALMPPARDDFAMVFDSSRAVTVLFGGWGGGASPLNDTWEWDGDSWSQSPVSNKPSVRENHAMAFDSVRAVTVLFGGLSNSTVYGDTWEWNGSQWNQQSPSISPPERSGHTMAFDSARGETLLFGGNGLNDTWTWSGTNWAEVFPADSPPVLGGPVMVFDSTRNVALLLGQNTSGNFETTWEWSGSNWAIQSPGTEPQDRNSSAMAFDSTRGVAVLFGGDMLFDTWQWNGTNWSELWPLTSPPGLNGHAMVYDSSRKTVVLFGGADFQDNLRNDTWTLVAP